MNDEPDLDTHGPSYHLYETRWHARIYAMFPGCHESCRAMGLGGLAEVAEDMGLMNGAVAKVCGQSISWWAAEVLVEVLMVAFPSVAR